MKEFEDWFLSQYGKKPMPSPKNGDEPHTNTYMTMFADGANKGWQACQSLNDKRIENYKSAYETWQDKTEWVQETSTAKELGLHRADVLKKRIDQLLAVIAKKDEALIKACEIIEKFSLQVYNGSDCLMVYDAVELQPADVELSDIGYISEDGEEVFLAKGLQIDAETCGVPVTKLYTIKTR